MRRERDALRTEQERSNSSKTTNGNAQGTTPFRNGVKGDYKAEMERLSHLFSTPVGRSQASNGSTFGGSAPPKFSFAANFANSDLPSLEKSTLERMKNAERKKMEERLKREEEAEEKEV